MFKKFITTLLITGVTIEACLPAITAKADANAQDYLGQTINSYGKKQGWYKFPDGSWGYYTEYGKLRKNVLINESDGCYGLNSDGKMITGWFDDTINNKWYHFETNGKLSIGWLKSDGVWYYTDNKGVMLTGWQKINQRWYYFDKTTGAMAANTTVEGYYLLSDGSLK